MIVGDLIDYAHRRGIRVGPGRGSAAGCAVAYCLRITDLDPIKYDLLFERFLNPSRKSMPDIDMDFDSRYHDEMIRYAAERYGRNHVAQIVTFSQIKAHAAVRDAARVLGYPYAVGDKIAKAMPPLIMGRDTPLRACLEPHDRYEDGYKMATELRDMYNLDPDVKNVVDVAKGLEGLRRQDGIHAAAVVITKEPLTEYLPIQRKPEGGQDPEFAPVVTQYEMHGVEDLGLLKMDFLGLRNLDVITDTLELIEQTQGVTHRHRQRRSLRHAYLQAVGPRRLDRCVPTRVVADASAHAFDGGHHVRRRRGLGCALSAGADGGQHAQRLRRSQERSQAGRVLPSRRARDPVRHVRAHGLPRADDPRRAEVRRLLAWPKPTTCARRAARRFAR